MKKVARKSKQKSAISLSTIDAKLDKVIDAMVTRDEMNSLKSETSQRLTSLEHSIGQLTTAIDKMRKSVDDILLFFWNMHLSNSRWRGMTAGSRRLPIR